MRYQIPGNARPSPRSLPTWRMLAAPPNSKRRACPHNEQSYGSSSRLTAASPSYSASYSFPTNKKSQSGPLVISADATNRAPVTAQQQSFWPRQLVSAAIAVSRPSIFPFHCFYLEICSHGFCQAPPSGVPLGCRIAYVRPRISECVGGVPRDLALPVHTSGERGKTREGARR
jgi:hypothetical protein